MSRANPRFRRTNGVLLPRLNDIYRVRFRGSVEGQLTINTFYYRGSGAINSESLAGQINLITALEAPAGMRDKYKACMSSDWTMADMAVDCPFLDTLNTLVAASIGAGGGAAGHEPTTVGVVIAKQSVVKGQCGRGHVTLPAVPTAWVTNSTLINSTAHDAFALAMGGVISGGGTTFTPVIYSKGTRINHTAGVTDVIQCVVRDTLGTVRRRKLGRGK